MVLLLRPPGPSNLAVTFGGYFSVRDIWLGLGGAFPLFDAHDRRGLFRAAEFGERRIKGAGLPVAPVTHPLLDGLGILPRRGAAMHAFVDKGA